MPRQQPVRTAAIVTALLLWLGLSHCHSSRHISMVSHRTDTATFIWTLNEDNLANNPFLLSNATSLRFDLYPPGRQRIKLSFGQGGWSAGEVKQLVEYLQSLQIITGAQRLKIDSLPQLRAFLLARRRGLSGDRIEITVR